MIGDVGARAISTALIRRPGGARKPAAPFGTHIAPCMRQSPANSISSQCVLPHRVFLLPIQPAVFCLPSHRRRLAPLQAALCGTCASR